jgi:hypothetical protein
LPIRIGGCLSSCQVCGYRICDAGSAIFLVRERLKLFLSAPESAFATDSVFFRGLLAHLPLLQIILRVWFVMCYEPTSNEKEEENQGVEAFGGC